METGNTVWVDNRPWTVRTVTVGNDNEVVVGVERNRDSVERWWAWDENHDTWVDEETRSPVEVVH